MFNHQRLKCYVLALGVARRVPTLIVSWPKGTGYLEDQLKRATSSIVLNIAEGNYRTFPKERQRFFSYARASAGEVSSILDIAEAYGFVGEDSYRIMQDELLQIVKILYKLK